MKEIVYKPSPTLRDFHKDNSFVRAILGPIGSGKSTACSVEIINRSCQQRPFQGVRKNKWLVIRNTYRELNDTTIATFFSWFPKELGTFKQQDMKWFLNKPLPDGTTVELEILFRALDRPDDVKKLLSLDLNGAWLNEFRELPREVFDMIQGRLGRYPSLREGGPSWFGLIADTNATDRSHWLYKLFEEDRPANFRLFKQPSGVSDEAENIANLPPDYYTNLMSGKTDEWINVYVKGLYGFITDGQPVFPEYHDDIHSTDNEFSVIGNTIYVGNDWGLSPAAVIGQITASGQLQILEELVCENMGAMNFSKLLKEKLQKYANNPIEIYGDPAGDQRSQTDELTVYKVLWNQGINAVPVYTNDFTIRREAVADYMQRLDFTGKPAFLISRIHAPMLRKALSGGYKYRRLQVSGQERYVDKPDKNMYSHVADALQYLLLGAVGGERVIGGYSSKPIDYSELNKRII